MKEKKKSDVAVLLDYAGNRKGLTFLGLALSAVSMLCSMVPYICIWLVARELIAVAPDWAQARSVSRYGYLAFAFAVGGIALYFAGLMCTHLAAFRTATNIRKQGVAHLMQAPLGYFDANASGLIRGRLDAAAADTETLLAHNLADIVGTLVLFLSMIVLMFVFDWRMGAACLLAAVISIVAMFSMMGGKNAQLMAEYQAAQDRMTKAGTEYVRGIPVVKIFQQTVYSFKAFREAIDDYSNKAEQYEGEVCKIPQSVNLTFTEGAFAFLVPVVLFLAPGALAGAASILALLLVFLLLSFVTHLQQYKATYGLVYNEVRSTRLSLAEQLRRLPLGYFGKRDLADLTETLMGDVNRMEHVWSHVLGYLYGAYVSTAIIAVCLFVYDWRLAIACLWGVPVAFGLLFGSRKLTARSAERTKKAAVRVSDGIQEALENVWEIRATNQEVYAAARAANCEEFVNKLPQGYETPIGENGARLSGGERQRISIARALLKDAPIVLLDEATASLDVENETKVQSALSRLLAGKTVLVIAHRMRTVEAADHIVVLAEGRVAEEGTPAELMARGGLFRRMVELQRQSAGWQV